MTSGVAFGVAFIRPLHTVCTGILIAFLMASARLFAFASPRLLRGRGRAQRGPKTTLA